MPSSQDLLRRPRFSLRGPLSAFAALTSVLLLATCDLDKITAAKKDSGPALSFTISGGSDVILGGTTPLSVTPLYTGTITRWTSNSPGVAKVDSVTGVVTGVSVGAATITARLLGMELDTGLVNSLGIAVRYKGVKITAVDSITGLGQTRTLTVFGTNAQDVTQPTAITGSCTFAAHDSGSTNVTIASVSATAVKALKNGTAYVKATCSGQSDSLKVKVRQVAKSITFADTVFTANALNFNRTIPITVKDVADSLYGNLPAARWRSNDTSIVSIDSISGIFKVKKRDTTRVFVRMDTVTRSTKVRLIQAVGSLAKTAGDAQTDTIRHTLAIAPVVTALDSGLAAVPNAPVTFRVGVGDSAVLVDSAKTTDSTGKATLGSWTLGKNAGSQSIIATSGAISVTFNATARAARPRKLAFSVNPSSAAVGATIAPSIQVAIQDSVGNLVTSATDNVTLAFNTNPNPSAALGGTLTVAAVNGIATFNNITVSAGGTGFVLLASSGTLTSAVSNSFDAFGTATKLAFTTQPVGSTAGGIMQPVRVAVQDANGATVTTATDNVTLTLGNPGTASLSGTTTVAAVNGVATFSNLAVSVAGTGYTLIAAATGKTGATSNTFTVSAVGTASRLAFSAQPTTATSGVAISPAIKVRVLDVNGAVVTSSSQQIALTAQDGTPLSGVTTVAAVSGEATFNNVVIAKANTGYKLVATAVASSITSATSAAFNITAAAAAKLGVIQQPTHTVVGQVIAPAVTVAVQDANGNTVTTQPATTVTIGMTTCSGGTLSGTNTASTSSGVASFSALTVGSTQATGCLLQATATGLSTTNSNQFNIVSTTSAVKLAFTTEPASATTAGVAMSGGTANFQDANGNNVSTGVTSVSISVLSGPSTSFGGTSSYSTGSSVSFPGLTFTKAGTYRLIVQAAGYRPDTSAQFTVSAAAASRVRITTQPTSIVAGVPFPTAVQASVTDQYDNTVTTATNVIQVQAFRSTGGSLRLNNGQNSISATAVNGIATFTGLSVREAATAAYLYPSSTSLGSYSSDFFDVVPAPLSALGFKTQPSPSFQAGATMNGIQVQAQDSVGNVIADFANPITLTLTGGAATAVLNGTKTVTPTSGLATFSTLSINQAGTGYQLSATATGVATATSNAFDINAGLTTGIAWIDQPQNTFANAPLNPSGQLPRIADVDQYGNVTNDGWGITITIKNPTAGMTLRQNGGDVTQWTVYPACPSTCTGIATLPADLAISTYGTGIQLLATSQNTSYGSATSAAFNIAAFDTKTKLGFVQQPTNSSYHVDFSPFMTVAVQDKYGNRDTTATDAISLSLSSNPGAATLSTTSLAGTKGLATFTPLTLDKPGNGYVITAAATGLTSAVSNSFNVTTPGVVAQYQNVCDMTRNGTTVFWIECSSTGKIISTPVTGGPRDTLVSGIANGYRLAADANNVYWIEGGVSNGSGAVKKVNRTSKVVTTLSNPLYEQRNNPNTFTIDGTNAYFVARSDDGLSIAIKSVPLTAAGAQAPTELWKMTGYNCTYCTPYFTVGGGFIFLMDPSADAIKRVPVTGGAATTVTTTGNGGGTVYLATNGTTLLLTQQSNLKTLANATTVASPTAPVTQISSGLTVYNWFVDGTSLYVNDGGTMRRYSLADFATVSTLGSGVQTGNASIFTDASDVFAFSSVGHIVKVAK